MKKIQKMKKVLLLVVALLIFLETPVYAATSYVLNQDCTNYIKGTTTASGKPVAIGYVAVHASSGTTPVIPFGTYIYIDQVITTKYGTTNSVKTANGQVSTWRVEDIGNGTGLSTYWVDFFIGKGQTTLATDFGIGKVDYHYSK
ncbi:hypothetical protein [Lacrimispora sp.]|uniref:hypothetical protein n=1 Tax=Lacrimispora sp. TaxID=2719234 RepID=UPI0028AC70F9|nr:hypothetical protein [Lacrimispora sp.]